MLPLDQGPHLPGETAERGEEEKTVTRERDEEVERGMNEMRYGKGRDWEYDG